jgi:hypothetical protein
MVLAPVLADSEEQALEDLAILEECPELKRALVREVNRPTGIDELLLGSDDFYPYGKRFATDNMWTDEPVERLLPGVRRIAETLPSAPSHMMWLVWGPCQELPDMAFSMQAENYIAIYAAYDDPAADAEHQAWVTGHMHELEPLASGIQLADENLGDRPFRFMAEENLERLERIREHWDRDRLFHSYMGVPR